MESNQNKSFFLTLVFVLSFLLPSNSIFVNLWMGLVPMFLFLKYRSFINYRFHIPSLFFIQNGKVVEQLFGLQTEAILENKLEEMLSKAS